ncbi:uncharacterized protein LOC113520256 [Galleria mellonella]|uniref:Uncharacterized protein LOC113520256 n=1 Tax=Galleria mellonella TaxID=7137 RepID=A0A6J3CFJ4_GALME|nr:uncharacterized protein LOC113520256 [Galleria mellonella]
MFRVDINKKIMFTPLWFVSIIALLIVDVRTGSLQQKGEKAQRCYFCPYTNNTCDHFWHLQIENCSGNTPYCATVAFSPNFTSFLQCAAPAEVPCTLTYSAEKYELKCICAGHLCNAPFSLKLLNDLHNFSTSNVPKNTTADFTDSFFKRYSTTNITDKNIYKLITIELTQITEVTEHSSQNVSQITTVSTVTTMHTVTHSNEIDIPRAEARKQEAAAPSDDDEDESEGSGSYDETKSQRHPPSAPAAPSSFLPANENRSSALYTKLFLTTSIFVFFIV